MLRKNYKVVFETEVTENNDLHLPYLPIKLLEAMCYAGVPELDSSALPVLKKYTVISAIKECYKIFGLKKRKEKRQFVGVIRSKTEYHTELKAHRILDPSECPHIIQLYESVQLSELRGLIVTHFYNTFDYKVLRPFAKLVVYQLLQALKVCHDHGVYHRDVKPDNIVFSWDGDKPHIYLLDFEIAFIPDGEHDMGQMCGTIDYMAPELYFCCMKIQYDKFDSWGAGLVLTELLLHKPRMLRDDRRMEQWDQKKDEWFKDQDPLAYDLVLKLLNEEPEDRIDVYDAFNHAYFDDVREKNDSKENKANECKKRKLDLSSTSESNSEAAPPEKRRKKLN